MSFVLYILKRTPFRLKDYFERLIFTDPLEYGKKIEDLLWRKVYYDFFLRCKQNRKVRSHKNLK